SGGTITLGRGGVREARRGRGVTATAGEAARTRRKAAVPRDALPSMPTHRLARPGRESFLYRGGVRKENRRLRTRSQEHVLQRVVEGRPRSRCRPRRPRGGAGAEARQG